MIQWMHLSKPQKSDIKLEAFVVSGFGVPVEQCAHYQDIGGVSGPDGSCGLLSSALRPLCLGEDPFTAAVAQPPPRPTRRAACKRRAKSPPTRERRRQAVKVGRSSRVSDRPDPAFNKRFHSALVRMRQLDAKTISKRKDRSETDRIVQPTGHSQLWGDRLSIESVG